MSKRTKKELAAMIQPLVDHELTSGAVAKLTWADLDKWYGELTTPPNENPSTPDETPVLPEAEVIETKDVVSVEEAAGVTSPMLNGIGKQVEQTNGPDILRKSAIESPCQFVWQMCEDMKLGQTDGARRKDVLQACTDAGVAFYTARTQIQLWKKAKDAPVEVTESVKLDASGNPITE